MFTIKFLMIIFLMIIVPELIGLLFLKFWKSERENILLAFPIGYIIEFAIAQLLTVPMIYNECSYQTLLWSFWGIIGGLSFISCLVNAKYFKDYVLNFVDIFLGIPKLLNILVIILIVLQCYMYVGVYTHLDDDDAYYVGTATTSIYTNTLFKYSPTTGGIQGEQLLLRYRLGPFPVYYAIFSSLLELHPTTVAHIILPIVFLSMAYMIFYILGYEMFDKDLNKTTMFVLIMCILNIFGNYSGVSAFSFLLLRIWQGKAILTGIILPFMFLLMLKAERNNYNIISCIILMITVIAGVFTTTMGVALPVIIIGILGLIFGIKDKNILNIVKCFICCIPAIIYGMMYLNG